MTLTGGDWEDGGHDEDRCDQTHPADGDPTNHKANFAQVEGPRLELLVVQQADGNGNGICSSAPARHKCLQQLLGNGTSCSFITRAIVLSHGKPCRLAGGV
jgi:hypothetical protein